MQGFENIWGDFIKGFDHFIKDYVDVSALISDMMHLLSDLCTEFRFTHTSGSFMMDMATQHCPRIV